jgi:hypothetical protein
MLPIDRRLLYGKGHFFARISALKQYFPRVYCGKKPGNNAAPRCAHLLSRRCRFIVAIFHHLFARHSANAGAVRLPPAQNVPACGDRETWDRAVVLSLARCIDANADRVAAWFFDDPIHELGGRTASQLVQEGATASLLDMLVAIRNGRRDA